MQTQSPKVKKNDAKSRKNQKKSYQNATKRLSWGVWGPCWQHFGPRYEKEGKNKDRFHFLGPIFGPKIGKIEQRNYFSCFFCKKKCKTRVFVYGVSFFLDFHCFCIVFWRPGTRKTGILAESGIKIQKITKSRLELQRERLGGVFSTNFCSFLGPCWSTLAEKGPKQRQNDFPNLVQKKKVKNRSQEELHRGGGGP